ncbi:MAG: ABC transporter permease [Vicinamibacterales bacterium]
MRSVAADIRYACRSLLRTPSFSLAVVVVLALGIGANTAVFSIVDAVLLRPLPYRDAGRLVRLFHVPPQSTFPGIKRFSVSPANFYDWQAAAHSFERMAIYHGRRFTLTGTSAAESVDATSVGAGFFEIVGMPPLVGRVFRPDEDAPAHGHVVMLSERFWKTHFGGAADAVGRTLRLAGESYRIVGVMPAQFTIQSWGAAASDLFVPVAFTPEERNVRDNHNDQAIARLKPGVTVQEANAEMAVISKHLAEEYPQADTGWGAEVISLQELIVGDIRMPLLMLLAAVGLVLLVACANVGNLLFARALGRRKEIAIRAALGAGRRRVFQQLLVESLVLACAGGAVGLVLAKLALSGGAKLLVDQVPRADEIALDVRVLLFVTAASIVTGIIAGVLPALRAGRTDLNESLKEGGRSDAAVGTRTRRVLIAAEIALSLVLLMGAGVMIRTLRALEHVDAGFDASNVLTLRVVLPETRYTAAQSNAFFDAALQRVSALPGVQAASTIDSLPTQGGSVQPVVLEGHAELLPRDQPTTAIRKVTPGYFTTMHIPILAGRDVTASDISTAVVSRAAARLLWGDVNPIGRRVTLPLESKTRFITIVGICGDVRQDSPSQPIVPTIYQRTTDLNWTYRSIALRTSTPPASMAPAVVAIIHGLDPEQPVENIETMIEVVDETLTSQRFTTLLLGIFSGIALVLAAVGIYSVLAYIVRGRRREIGIRTALGARATDVVALVIVEGLAPVVAGLVVGIVGALGSSRLLSGLVFGVRPSDPLTLVVGTVAILLVSLIAMLFPAYRATRVDPVEALRA